MEYRKKCYVNENWKTAFRKDPEELPPEQEDEWVTADLPHNWEDYQGYRGLSHGNLHGTAWYRKRLRLPKETGRWFLELEGAGSYTSLWCNGRFVGEHRGGRTVYTADITEAARPGEENEILVRTDHPEKIDDLPWVCGGCWGTPNTEGSQPVGIFRPVSFYRTGSVRVQPFGVGVLCTRNNGTVFLEIRSELKNYSAETKKIWLCQQIFGPRGEKVSELTQECILEGSMEKTVVQSSDAIESYELWDTEHPNLYRLKTIVREETADKHTGILDEVENSFGIRFLEWENFEDADSEVLNETLLTEEACEANQYFLIEEKNPRDSHVRIAPGGVIVRILEEKENQYIEVTTELVNDDERSHQVELESFIQTYNRTKSIADLKTTAVIGPGEHTVLRQITEGLRFLDQWTMEKPYYHQVSSTVRETENPLQEPYRARVPFGVYRSEKPVNKAYPYYLPEDTGAARPHRLLLNGKPVSIRGTCEYEHLLGKDHAFTEEQIHARMDQIRAAGFNSFREAHCPHNLRYLEACEQNGILYWAQMGAHLYFDKEEFRENFRVLTKEWLRERRNSPSVILWGIQNESMLPESFAAEITGLIRSIDPTASKQRLVVTCNGGTGSDWNIPQNWSGTYGGSVEDYGNEIVRQRLAGEYGQYRVVGKHEEGDVKQKQNTGGDVSEELFCYCLQTKLREMEKKKDLAAGHFQWIFSSHANPGRETIYCLDAAGDNRIGVVNNKGLLTCYGELSDAYYMYCSHYVPKTRPMIYIVSHTWPDRFAKGPAARSVTVYSNCDEVALYNDAGSLLLGRKRKGNFGEPFVFDNVMVNYGLLYARGYVDGVPCVEDMIWYENLPMPENAEKLMDGQECMDANGLDGGYLYRVNCGGEDYLDQYGRLWKKDQPWDGRGFGFSSWAMEYPGLAGDFGSRGRICDRILNTKDQELFQSYRYGREKLSYSFEVEPGTYEVELYFTEPWYGRGGLDCARWRLFDVAVNQKTVLSRFDIWKEAGACRGLKKTVSVQTDQRGLTVHFPKVWSYQAVICAIAIKKKGA